MTAGFPGPGPLRLRAADAEDLEIISAHLQDAILPLADMTFLAEQRRFVMVVNRFKWETGAIRLPIDQDNGDAAGGGEAGGGAAGERPERAVYLRTHCGVRFENVTAARRSGINLRDRGRLLSLLAIRAEPGAVLLCFAGGGMIRLETATIDCRLEDIGEPWPTPHRPGHPFEEVGQTS